ncbi:hypothetical protein [Mycobacterium sp.]|uniref:hypothetical protein n=1 Tax=Mycobacterium sp. TaxID=1785 RepID=UPI0025D5B11D|nr:hypothetical protein [Mycobacterium sp.]
MAVAGFLATARILVGACQRPRRQGRGLAVVGFLATARILVGVCRQRGRQLRVLVVQVLEALDRHPGSNQASPYTALADRCHQECQPA